MEIPIFFAFSFCLALFPQPVQRLASIDSDSRRQSNFLIRFIGKTLQAGPIPGNHANLTALV